MNSSDFRVGQVVTVTGTIRTITELTPDTHLRLTLDCDLAARAAQTDAATALDEVERRLDCHCSQRWGTPKGAGGDPARCAIHGDTERIIRQTIAEVRAALTSEPQP